MAKKKSDTYSVKVECSNCDKSGTVELPRGTPVSHNMECPNCGCATASRPMDPVPMPYYVPVPFDPVRDRRNNEPFINPPYRVGDSPDFPGDITVTFRGDTASSLN